jgi:hypothetical protein
MGIQLKKQISMDQVALPEGLTLMLQLLDGCIHLPLMLKEQYKG